MQLKSLLNIGLALVIFAVVLLCSSINKWMPEGSAILTALPLIAQSSTSNNATNFEGILFETNAPEQEFHIKYVEKSAESSGNTMDTATEESGTLALNDVYFETVVQNSTWTFSISESHIQEISTRITNHTQAPICFAFPEPFVPPRLEVVAPDGSSLKMQIDSAIFPPPNTPLGVLIQPNDSELFTVKTFILELPNNRLAMVGILNLSTGRWFIDLPETGTYKVRLSYANSAPLGSCNLAANIDSSLDPLWTGLAEPPFIEIQIVRSDL